VHFDPPLVPATLIARYKRFLFDATLESGEVVTGHCPNTGSMLGLTEPGSDIFFSEHDNPARKYTRSLEIVSADGTLVGVNTGLPNGIAAEAIAAGLIPALSGYSQIARERKYGRNSRIDILLSGGTRPDCYVEVKNVHFSRSPGLAEFPDTKTARGTKHLEELGDVAETGCRAVMLYVIQRADCDHLKLCRDLDPVYTAAFDRAIRRGVEAYAINCSISRTQISAHRLIPVCEPGIQGI
jgi:sugar fermentation stimulation protein A